MINPLVVKDACHGKKWLDIRRINKESGWGLSKQQIYDILNDIGETDHLAPCGKPMTFTSWDRGYTLCGRTCACALDKMKLTTRARYGVDHVSQSAAVRDKTRETNMERYGVENPAQSSTVQEQIKATTLERYGVDHVSQSAAVRDKTRETNVERYGETTPLLSGDIREKTRKTNVERYGADHHLSNRGIRDKIKETSRERYGENHFAHPEVIEKTKSTIRTRYGVEHVSHSEEIRDKARETNLARYGVENPAQSPAVQEQMRDTVLERYGVEHVSQSPEIRQKVRETNLTRYGVEHYAQAHIDNEAIGILNSKDLLGGALETQSITAMAEQLGVDPSTICNYRARHGLPAPRSSYESEMFHVIKSVYPGDVLQNKRKYSSGLELDFYIRGLNLGIEFNGLYWHSSIHKCKNYHREKYLVCRNVGIRLMMFNEDEWLERKSAVASKIANALGASPRGKPARKLILNVVDSKTANQFFDTHHIQGKTAGIMLALGAYDGDELVGVMAFNNRRHGGVELVRFCSSGATHAGMFSKLLKRAQRDHRIGEVVSFADLRYSEGAVYHANGFELVSEIPPDYRYIWRNRTWHKSHFTKARIAKIFGVDTSAGSESHIMECLNIPRIYDCGKLKFILRG